MNHNQRNIQRRWKSKIDKSRYIIKIMLKYLIGKGINYMLVQLYIYCDRI